jgi:hypothetical protein
MSNAMRCRLGLLALGVLLSLGTEIQSPKSEIRNPKSEIQSDRFGFVHVNSTEITVSVEQREKRYQHALDAGAAWTRWPIYWDLIESAAGFDYSLADAVLSADVAHSLRVNAILLRTPEEYASGGSTAVPGPQVGQRRFTLAQRWGLAAVTTPPVNLYEPVFLGSEGPTDDPRQATAINPANYWARFVHRTVQRYKPGGELADQQGWPEGAGIRHWEIWNEPDRPFWSGTVEEYYRLLQVGYLAAKFADPESRVLMGGMAYWAYPGKGGDGEWFAQLLDVIQGDPEKELQEANGYYFDVTAWHWYSNPRDLYDKARWVQDQLQQASIQGKGLWVNETNVPIWDEYPGPTWDPESEGRATIEEQAAYIIQAHAEGLAAGVERILAFQLYDDCGNGPESWDAFGLIRNPAEADCWPHPDYPDVPRPAYTAYQIVTQELNDVQPVWRSLADGLGRVALYRSPSERVLVVWNWEKGERAVPLWGTGNQGVLIDQEGNRQTLTPSGGLYTLTLAPATNTNWQRVPEPMIGGKPYILIETDTRPPTGQITLPAISPPTFTVTWRVEDWGTGLQGFRVWYKAGDGEWTLWQKGSPPADRPYRAEGSASFQGDEGQTYCFAAWGQDRAGNETAFPPTAPQCTTVTEGGTLTGTVWDVLEAPIAGARVTATDGEGASWSATTDNAGLYLLEGLPFGESYSVLAEREGYGSWAARQGVQLVATTTAGVDFHLPPALNAVTNGGFEGASALEDWDDHPPGKTAPILSDEALSGAHSVLLGSGFVGPPENSTIGQVIRVPSGVLSPTLSFSYKLVTEETALGPGGQPNDWFEVLVFSGPEWTQRHDLSVREMWQNTDWTHRHFPMDPFAGQEVLLVFNLWQSSAERPTRVWLDEVAVGPAVPFTVEEQIYLPLMVKEAGS